MSKNSGHIVETKTGKKGIIYHLESLLNKKRIVHLIDENNNVIVDENDKEVKMLCNPKSLKIIGFID